MPRVLCAPYQTHSELSGRAFLACRDPPVEIWHKGQALADPGAAPLVERESRHPPEPLGRFPRTGNHPNDPGSSLDTLR
jgi:hypothetical protein